MHFRCCATPRGAAAQQEPKLMAAFSRAACRHLAVPLMLGAVGCTRKCDCALRKDAPPGSCGAPHRLGQQYCPITARIANLSFARRLSIARRSRQPCRSLRRRAAVCTGYRPTPVARLERIPPSSNQRERHTRPAPSPLVGRAIADEQRARRRIPFSRQRASFCVRWIDYQDGHARCRGRYDAARQGFAVRNSCGCGHRLR